MILYFTGTGNSRYAAQIIEKVTGDKLVSINEYLKNNMNGVIRSEEPFVFVVPTYAWRIPRVVEQFIRDTEFSGTNKIYFIMTCGGQTGNSVHYIKKLCDDKGFNLKGFASVVMPDNYIVMYDVQSKEKCDEIIEKSDEKIFHLADVIKSGESFEDESVGIKDKLMSSVINPLFYSMYVKADGFYSNEKCIGCSKCVELCPLNNIKIVDNKPEWGDDCTHCMACICGCPVEAVEYKNKTKNRNRYYNRGY